MYRLLHDPYAMSDWFYSLEGADEESNVDS